LSESLVARVSSELACDPSTVRFTPIAACGYIVVACGMTTTYCCTRTYEHKAGYADGVYYRDACIREGDWRPAQ
jgi:hypothetical protein